MHYMQISFARHNQGGRGIKGGGQARSAWPCAQSWWPNSNFYKKLQKLNANAQHTIISMLQTSIHYNVYNDDIWRLVFLFSLNCLWQCHYTIVELCYMRLGLQYNCSYLQALELYVDNRKRSHFTFWWLRSCVWIPHACKGLKTSGIRCSSLYRQ